MIVQKTLRVDVATEQSFVYLKAKQYDESSRTYRVIITNRDIPIAFKGTEFVTVRVKRPDKTYVDGTCTWENGELFLTLTEGMLAITGEALLEFAIYDINESTVISTTYIHLDIQRSILPYEKMVKSDEFNVLNNLILQAAELPNQINEINVFLEQCRTELEEIQAIKAGLTTE